MWKKTLAIMLAAVMLLQPITASAVTWNQVVTGLKNSGTGSYSIEGTSATQDADGAVRIEGGTVSDVFINVNGQDGKYTFVDVTLDGQQFTVMATSGGNATVTLEGQTSVGTERFSASAQQGQMDLVIGEAASVQANGINVSATQMGALNVENSGAIHAENTLSGWTIDGGKLIVANTASGSMSGGESVEFAAQGENSNVKFANDGSVDSDTRLGLVAVNGGIALLTNGVTGVMTSGDRMDIRARKIAEIDGADANWTSVDVLNEGAIHAGYVTVSTAVDGSATMVNTGDVDARVTVTGGEMGDLTGDYQAGFSNEGTVAGDVSGNAYAGGSLAVINYGDVAGMEVTANENSTAFVTNNGTAEYVTGGALDDSTVRVNSWGTAGEVNGNAEGNGTVTVENTGIVSEHLGVNAQGNSTATLDNMTPSDIRVMASGNSVVTVNNGSAAATMSTPAEADGSSSEGGAGVPGDSIAASGYISAETMDAATVIINNVDYLDSIVTNSHGESEVVVNNAAQVGFMDMMSAGSASATVNNHEGGSVDSLWNYSYDQSSISVTNEGAVKDYVADIYDSSETTVSGSGTVDTATVWINTPTADTLSAEQIKGILAQIELPETADVTTELWTTNGEEFTARYEIDENGNVTLIETLVEQQPVEDNGPSEEMRRHEREMKRAAGAIGGVYGSPEWLKQAYLGYHSINIRLYENGERTLFRQDLAWMEDGTDNKRLVLRTEVENPQALMLHIDGKAIETLERAQFSTITLLDYNKNPYMEYSVADLKAAREQYGLAETDTLCVGNGDAEVMKIGADGKMVPLEQSEEAEAAAQTPAA